MIPVCSLVNKKKWKRQIRYLLIELLHWKDMEISLNYWGSCYFFLGVNGGENIISYKN